MRLLSCQVIGEDLVGLLAEPEAQDPSTTTRRRRCSRCWAPLFRLLALSSSRTRSRIGPRANTHSPRDPASVVATLRHPLEPSEDKIVPCCGVSTSRSSVAFGDSKGKEPRRGHASGANGSESTRSRMLRHLRVTLVASTQRPDQVAPVSVGTVTYWSSRKTRFRTGTPWRASLPVLALASHALSPRRL